MKLVSFSMIMHIVNINCKLVIQESEGEWKWESGKPLEKDFWHPGEPNNNDGEDCAKANAWR